MNKLYTLLITALAGFTISACAMNPAPYVLSADISASAQRIARRAAKIDSLMQRAFIALESPRDKTTRRNIRKILRKTAHQPLTERHPLIILLKAINTNFGIQAAIDLVDWEYGGSTLRGRDFRINDLMASAQYAALRDTLAANNALWRFVSPARAPKPQVPTPKVLAPQTFISQVLTPQAPALPSRASQIAHLDHRIAQAIALRQLDLLAKLIVLKKQLTRQSNP